MTTSIVALLGLMAATPTVPACEPDRLVQSFYTLGLVEKQVRPAFERFVSADFIEHKPDIATANREGAIAFLETLVADLPDARWEILRVAGDGELVAVHARFTAADGAPAYAIADFFRVEGCLIREHWDVISPPPVDAPNPLSRF